MAKAADRGSGQRVKLGALRFQAIAALQLCDSAALLDRPTDEVCIAPCCLETSNRTTLDLEKPLEGLSIAITSGVRWSIE